MFVRVALVLVAALLVNAADELPSKLLASDSEGLIVGRKSEILTGWDRLASHEYACYSLSQRVAQSGPRVTT